MSKVVKKGSKGLQKLTPIKRQESPWERAFLTALAQTANITESARLAKITRQRAYDLRESSEEFRQAWGDALEQACDGLELEARRRAERGVSKAIFYKGKPIGTEINYSDTLMIFLLKAHRPEKYRERFEHSGPGGGPVEHRVIFEVVDGSAGNQNPDE